MLVLDVLALVAILVSGVLDVDLEALGVIAYGILACSVPLFLFAVPSLLVLARWGTSPCDRYVFGLWGCSLSRDTSRVRFHVRGAGLRGALARLALAPGSSVAAVDSGGATPQV